jgi:flagellar basal body rod protein FlgG
MYITTERIFGILENRAIARRQTITHNMSSINTPGFKCFLNQLNKKIHMSYLRKSIRSKGDDC